MAKTKRAQEALDVDRELYSGLIRLHVLHHAAEEPIFGLGMLEELSRHGYRISPGTLYPILHGLEKKGYCVRPSGATENLCVDYTGLLRLERKLSRPPKAGSASCFTNSSLRVTIMINFLIRLGALAGTIGIAAFPQQVSLPGLTLSRAVEQALQNYPSLQISQADIEAAGARIRLARTAYLPRFDALGQVNRATRNNVFGLLLPQSVFPSMSGPAIGSNNFGTVWGSALGALRHESRLISASAKRI